eukprot:TRINITY_DN33_c8_g1_i1.p1 TRINITY_DN33_c8_g1~~TRINITY_DN33_c8_g1_i1.p1  ORF type:complete len:983 (+),score=168.44 TRINITY_DN33_c8_g1_i1:23-2950(+)
MSSGPVRLAKYGDTTSDQLTEVQKDPERVRNFCMLAHVDHGKTSLSDVLISSNGLISSVSAGKVRYLDSRIDEQEKLITMKASTIALEHTYSGQSHVLNLIDSPGHVDFSCEVSTAVRLSDGALILVDAVDGVSTQTRAVLEQAYREKVKCILVINKIDLLITSQQLDPVSAYNQLSLILQDVNVLIASFAVADNITASQINEDQETDSLSDTSEGHLEGWFEPSKGNVIFASAWDAWGFTTRNIARVYAKKLGWSENKLTQALWGEWYIDPKKKKIQRKPPKPDSQPMCVKFMLEQIWRIYETAQIEDLEERSAQLTKMAKALNIEIKESVLKKDSKQVASHFMSSWVPLAKCVLDAAVVQLPSPVEAQKYRLIPRMMPDLPLISDEASRKRLQDSVLGCDPLGDIMIYAAKMMDVDQIPGSSLQDRDVTDNLHEADTSLIAVCRIFSGTIKKGDSIRVLHPKHKPGSTSDSTEPIQVHQLYLLMGRGLEPVNEVSAGNIFGIGGLGSKILKSGTLTNREPEVTCGFSQMVFQSAAVIRLSIEPVDPTDLGALQTGLELLNKADPQVEIGMTESGENIISTAGEVHAERCIRDLSDKYAKVEMKVSEPIVSFRETVISENKKPTTVSTSGKSVSFSIRAVDLPPEILKFLEDNETLLRTIRNAPLKERQSQETMEQLKPLKEAFCAAGRKWASYYNGLWDITPYMNLLVCSASDVTVSGIWNVLKEETTQQEEQPTDDDTSDYASSSGEALTKRKLIRQLNDSVLAGFHMATDKGPLCDEPMTKVCFIIDDIIMNTAAEDNTSTYGPLSGQVISAVYSGFRQAFMVEGKRLVEPIYECSIFASSACHGRVYEVIKKRRATILDEIPREGTEAFTVVCHLPVAESFGLADELRIKTSGSATPVLQFYCWQTIEEDPYFVRRTEDELEDMDETDVHIIGNVPRTLINRVRRRKGLRIEEQAVQKAEKMKKYSTRGS